MNAHQKIKTHFDKLLSMEQESLSKLEKMNNPSDNDQWRIQLIGMRVSKLKIKILTLDK